MRTLFQRMMRALLGLRKSEEKPSRVERPSCVAKAHCNSCGTARWGRFNLPGTPAGNGIAVFRCERGGKPHVTMYAVTSRHRRHGPALSFRALSHNEHFVLGAKVRAEHLKSVGAKHGILNSADALVTRAAHQIVAGARA